MILVIDNYDSFTFNLVQYLGESGADVQVARNDEVDLAGIRALNPEGIIISPGPGRPENTGIVVAMINEYLSRVPMLGVCLGHQAIGFALGGRIVAAPTLMHGKTSNIFHDASPLFSGVPSPFTATRYHSLIIAENSLPVQLQVTAKTEDQIIMGVQHRDYPVYGVQFHPESILTDQGKTVLNNFLQICSKQRGTNHD